MNNYYTFAPQFIPGTLARAGDVNTQFGLVQTAFDKITSGNATIGVDSGAVNALVITLPTVRTSYTNGDEVVFMPAVQNTGPATINVSGVGVIGLKRFNGSALQSGDLLTGTWYIAKYASASNTYEIIAPAAYTTAAGVVSGAAPVNKVGLVAAGGVSVNVLPIDATFALDQSIVPTWTGAHIFSSTVALNGSVTAAGTILSTNGTSAALIVRGDIARAAWQNTATTPVLVAGTVKAWLNSGVNVTDAAVGAVAALNLYSGNLSTASVSLDSSGNTNILGGAIIGAPTGGQKGTGTLNATGIFINNVAVGVTANPTALAGLVAVNGVATTYMRSDGAPAIDQTIAPTWTSQHTFTVSGGGINSAVFINAATQPGIGFRDAAGAADSKVWDFTSNATQILGRLINDAASISRNFIQVTRGGVAVGDISFGNATDNPTYTFLGTGGIVINTAGPALLLKGVTAGVTSSAYMTLTDSVGARSGYFGNTGASGGPIRIAADNSHVQLMPAIGSAAQSTLDGGATFLDLGWRDLPANSQASGYLTVLTDRGKMILGVSGGSYTIAANASVAYPVGSAITFANNSGGNMTIGINTDTLVWSGVGTTGSRTLANNGVATALKVNATGWFISGSGLS